MEIKNTDLEIEAVRLSLGPKTLTEEQFVWVVQKIRDIGYGRMMQLIGVEWYRMLRAGSHPLSHETALMHVNLKSTTCQACEQRTHESRNKLQRAKSRRRPRRGRSPNRNSRTRGTSAGAE